MSQNLAEKTEGLASRVKNLAVHHAGESGRQLLEEQDKLAKLALAAIVKELNEEHEDYEAALQGLDNAIDYIGNADKQIEGVSEAIKLTAKAVALVEKALKNAPI